MLEKRLLKVPEVKEVFARTGTAEVATDPMPPSTSDNYIMLKPRKEWPDPDKPKAAVVAEIQEAAEDVPGNAYGFSQPIQQRMNELISGVRSDVAVKIFGDDLDVLIQSAARVQAVLQKVQGAADVKTEQASGLPVLTVKLNRQALSRYGINVADVQNLVEIAVGGKSAGRVFEGDRRFDIVVRLPEHLRSDIEAIRSLPVPLPPVENQAKATPALWGNSPLAQIRYVPLSELAQIDLAPGPNLISREDGKRRIVVTANVRGRDLSSFIADAQQQVTDKVKLPPGYWIGWGGQFEQLVSATQRLTIVVPLALFLIFLLLFMSLGSMPDALLVFSGVPLALTGGVAALLLRGNPALDQRRHRLHRAFRRRGAQWPRHHHVHREASPGRAAAGRRGPGRRAHPAATGSDDSARRLARLRSDGDRHRRRRRSAATACDRRHRRDHFVDDPHAAGVARSLRPVPARRAANAAKLNCAANRRRMIMKFVLLLPRSCSASPASAEEYEKGPNGGLMLDVAGIDAELLTRAIPSRSTSLNPSRRSRCRPRAIRLRCSSSAAPARETVDACASGENSLKGDAKNPIPAGATITLTIKTAEGKSGQVKFKK